MDIRNKRQQEFAHSFLSLSRRVGILLLSVRMGKTRCALNILNELYEENGNMRVLVCYPENSIKDSWEEEIATTLFSNHYITFTNFRSLDKHIGEKWGVIIVDECHALSEAQIVHLQALQKECWIVLGLTGTLSRWSEKALKRELGWPVIAKYTQEQAILDGIVSDYEITVHTIPLDNQQLIQYKKRKCTEKQQFGAYSFVIDKIDKDGRDSMFLRLARMRIIQSSLSKITLTRRLLAKYRDERVLVFCGIIKVAETLGIPTDHSGKKDDRMEIDKFKNGEGNHLAVCKMASMGVTFKPLDRVIINYFDSNSENLQQRIARATNLDFVGKIAKIDIICLKEQVELDWLSKALIPFNKQKIKYI